MFKWLELYFTVSIILAADLAKAVGPFTSVPGWAETVPSVKAILAFLPLGKAPVCNPKPQCEVAE